MQNKKIHPQHILKKEKCVFFSLTMVGALKTQLKRTGVHFIEDGGGGEAVVEKANTVVENADAGVK